MRHTLFKILSIALICVVGVSNYASATEQLQLPTIPDSLRQPSKRAGYLIENFWDNLDFNDRQAQEDAFMEQAFSNFISVIPIADTDSRTKAINTLFDRAAVNPQSYDKVFKIAELYLYKPESPYLDESIYEIVLKKVLADTILDTAHKIRPNRQLKAVNKNKVGTKASDFRFTLVNGAENTLYNIDLGDHTLLIFYDPDCGHCMEEMEKIKNEAFLNDKIRAGKFGVLAVYSGDERELWKQRADRLPAEWTIGYEDGTIQEEDVYEIRQLPTLYLLDRNKNVILKECTVTALCDYLRKVN